MSLPTRPIFVRTLDDRQRISLDGATRSATMTVEVGEDDGVLRGLSLHVSFGVDPLLASVVNAQLDFEMTIAHPGETISVAAPV
jgi:hypothetical protein